MKILRYTTVLFLALLGFWGNEAVAGDPPVAGDTTVSDTTEPASPAEKLLSDTSELLAMAVRDSSEEDDEGDPTKPKVRAPLNDSAALALEAMEDTPASELYDEFDTTAVHSEKFDALAFNDTIYIPLKDPAHCEYVHPFNGQLTSSFGFRKSRYHFGVDINLETGDTVRCAFDGKVRIAQRSKTYGYLVVVRHNNGLETYYAHLSKLCVSPGDDVEAGTLLGLGGNTGRSYGSHLHFEVRFRGQPIDPNYFIDFKNQVLRTDTYCLTKSDFKYLSHTYKVKHYSRKKKKTWYSYYTPGGAYYATAEAKRIMNEVPPPVMPGSGAYPADSGSCGHDHAAEAPAPKTPATTAKPAPAKTTTAKTTTAKSSTAKTGTVYHTVRKGDTLSAIAVRYGTSVDKLCQLNGIKKTTILQIGRKLKVK